MTRESTTVKLTQADLEQFRGTTGYYRYSLLFPFLYLTDGTKFIAEKGGCYWLFDLIAALQFQPKTQKKSKLKQIQFWTLTVHADKSATLICEWDEGKTVYEEKIVYTNFPLHKVEIWVQPMCLKTADKPSDFLAFLPTEY